MQINLSFHSVDGVITNGYIYVYQGDSKEIAGMIFCRNNKFEVIKYRPENKSIGVFNNLMNAINVIINTDLHK
jgi:hypothetical protein